MLRLSRRPGACGGTCTTTPADLLASIIIWIVPPPPSPFSFPSSSLPLFNRPILLSLIDFIFPRHAASCQHGTGQPRGRERRGAGGGDRAGTSDCRLSASLSPQRPHERVHAGKQGEGLRLLRQWLACEKEKKKTTNHRITLSLQRVLLGLRRAQWNHESIEDALAEEFDLGLDSIGSGGAVRTSREWECLYSSFCCYFWVALVYRHVFVNLFE